MSNFSLTPQLVIALALIVAVAALALTSKISGTDALGVMVGLAASFSLGAGHQARAG